MKKAANMRQPLPLNLIRANGDDAANHRDGLYPSIMVLGPIHSDDLGHRDGPNRGRRHPLKEQVANPINKSCFMKRLLLGLRYRGPLQ
jgi:hypothetical protein